MGSVFKRKDSSVWWITYSIAGQRKRVSAGKTKAQAQALLAKIETEIFEGSHFPEKRRVDLTIAGLRDLWLELAAEKKSLRMDRVRFKTIVDHFGAATRLAGLSRLQIERFKAKLRATKTRYGKPMSSASVNRHLALLRAAINAAGANGYLHRDPMKGFKLLPENNERDRTCTLDEYKALCDAANHKLRLMIVVAYNTGMRLSEIATLKWSQIDAQSGLVRLKAGDVKTGRGRTVPLNNEARDALAAFPRRIDGRLFGVKPSTFPPQFSRLTKKLGIEDLRFHDLRHTAATNFRRNGIDVITLKKIIGHKSWEMMERYQTVDHDDLLAAVGRSQEPR